MEYGLCVFVYDCASGHCYNCFDLTVVCVIDNVCNF